MQSLLAVVFVIEDLRIPSIAPKYFIIVHDLLTIFLQPFVFFFLDITPRAGFTVDPMERHLNSASECNYCQTEQPQRVQQSVIFSPNFFSYSCCIFDEVPPAKCAGLPQASQSWRTLLFILFIFQPDGT